MSPSPESQAWPVATGDLLAALILDSRTHTVLGCTDSMSQFLNVPLIPGQPVPAGLLRGHPGDSLPAQVTLHGRRGPLPCQVTPVGGWPHASLLCPDHQLSRSVLDHIPLDVAVLNASGQYLYVNEAAIRDPQVRRGIIGLTDREYMTWRGHPLDRAAERERLFQQAASSGAVVEFTEVYPGETAPQYLKRTYRPVFDQTGALQMMVGFGEDRSGGHELAEQMSLLRTMVDTSVDPLLVLNAQPGPGHLRVKYTNPAMLDLLRQHGLDTLPDAPMPEWPMAEGNGMNILALLAQLAQLPLGSTYRDVLFLPEAQQWLEVHVNAILDLAGARTHWAISLRDVTTQRRTELWQERVARAHGLALSGATLSASLGPLLQEVDHWEVGWQIGAVIASEPPLVVGQLPGDLQQLLSHLPPGTLDCHWRDLDPQQSAGAVSIPDLQASAAGAPLHRLLRPLTRSLIELPLYGQDGQLLGAFMAVHAAPHAWAASVAETLHTLSTTGAILAEQHLTRERLERLAYHDPLTRLLNRAALTDRAVTALRQPSALALGLMDLNRFRFLNDGFGHPVGDQLLRELARRLRALADRHALLALARMGGDEFGLLARPEQIERITADLQAVFEQPFEVHGAPLLLEASMGWSVAPGTAQDAPTLLQQADAALYEAKRSQRFSQRYTPAPPAPIPTVTMESALRESLRDHHFRLVYQPQVHLSSGVLVGAEALLRWTHPALGPVMPDQFIPVAELAGLMPRLGEWVMHAACQEAARWSNTHLTVSVNVSSRQLSDSAFSDRVRQALSSSALHPQRLVLEVTESGLIDNPTRVREVLQDLRTLGVRVSMDDFGTGYSSLFTLRSLPVDELKIDRAFVRDLGQDTQAGRESHAIVCASVLMARALHIELLAEGVETAGQADALREAGCDLGQGWLYARALEPAEFDRFEQGWPARLIAPRAGAPVSGSLSG
ncbi:sensor domain-containing protein [Deinococcus sedimenti]|uniref:EAL domain-containing protein n=1 Tax=Deinococcus sedimenti TaxID=1867090 RepID=A0ABQ2S356_9DEIO|nr:EAL domain-containing protein [Deinococcus sedimenti]GGR91967.1 hypothetical protein GCM10008960_18640 [Deinococcus sedimenti]